MNIFYLSHNPQAAAEYHCDQHVNKMIVETAQMLSTVHWILDTPKVMSPLVSRPTHENHPCIRWLLESSQNYDYLVALGLALGDEFDLRYSGVHADLTVIRFLAEVPMEYSGYGTSPARAFGKEKIDILNPVEAYREYYRRMPFGPVWKRGRSAPYWW